MAGTAAFCFSLLFEDRSLDFKAPGEKECRQWLKGLQAAVDFSQVGAGQGWWCRTGRGVVVLWPTCSGGGRCKPKQVRRVMGEKSSSAPCVVFVNLGGLLIRCAQVLWLTLSRDHSTSLRVRGGKGGRGHPSPQGVCSQQNKTPQKDQHPKVA